MTKVVPNLRKNLKVQRPLLSLILCATFTLTGCGINTAASESPSPNPAVTIKEPVSTATPIATSISIEKDPIALKMAKMTLEDKIGQMLLVGIEGTVLDPSAKRMISEDKVGGIILYGDNISNLQGMVKLINNLKVTNKNNPAPLFISVDEEGGKVSRMPKEFVTIPSNRTVGNTNNARLAQTMGELLGRELTLTGFNMNFAPVLDVNSNAQNPIIGNRSFGSSAARVTKMGLAEIKGLRSEGIIPVVKHYPGHGDTSVDSHLELPVVNKTEQQLAKLEWIPFQAAIKDKAEAVMVAHILFPKLDPNKPASLSKVIIGEHLRGEMGYKGVVITDDLTMGAIMKHYKLAEAAIDTIKAGSDILLIAHGYDNEKLVLNKIKQSVNNGTISESRIDESVRRILSLKSKYKLSDNKPVSVPNLTSLNQDIRSWRLEVQNK
ncbi:MAG: beta-N-acetylhexosaminidase [Paenibacillus sp.]|nr:beta-N-acetylhexosaminidase [Paenibacillus sp.]